MWTVSSKYLLMWIALLRTPVGAQFSATLLPTEYIINVCPGQVHTLTCNESRTGYLYWEWRSSNGMMSRRYFRAENLNIPMPLVQSHNEEVNTTLLSLVNSFVSSTLQFTLSGNVLSANVTCNQESRRIKVVDCSTPVNFSIVINATENDISNIHISWSNHLNMNFTYYVNISTNFKNDKNAISTDNLCIDFTSRVGVSYNIYISTYCCNNLTEIGDFQFTILRNNSIKVIGDILYNINSINQDNNISEDGSFITTISTDTKKSFNNVVTLNSSFDDCSCENFSSFQTIILPIGSVVIAISILLNIGLVIEIVRIRRKTSCSSNKHDDDKIEARGQIDQSIPLYEQVDSEKEVTSVAPNAAYGIQQRKKNSN